MPPNFGNYLTILHEFVRYYKLFLTNSLLHSIILFVTMNIGLFLYRDRHMKRILAIDGGGIKGVFPASFLATVEDTIEDNIAGYNETEEKLCTK